jgi:hypothetical protein
MRKIDQKYYLRLILLIHIKFRLNNDQFIIQEVRYAG